MSKYKLRKVWDTEETREEEAKNTPITPDDIGEEELVRVETEGPDYRYYSLICLYNSNKYRTLFNSKMHFNSFHAGRPHELDSIRYDIIPKERANEFYQRPKDHVYTEKEFLENFSFKNKARLLSKRTRMSIKYINRHNQKCYMIDQEIDIGDLGPESSAFLVITTLGSNEFGSHGKFCGDTWDSYKNELKEIEKRRKGKGKGQENKNDIS